MSAERLNRAMAMFTETFGLGRSVIISSIALISVVVALTAYWFLESAPPTTLIITSGPEGSIFHANAEKYRKILERNGVKLKNLTSQGSLENLKRLDKSPARVDVGFVQSGITDGVNVDKLVSLGSASYQPLLVFYRSESPVTLLSDLNGKRLAIGPVGSGTRSLALTLLETNGIVAGGATVLLDLEAEEASKALLDHRVDALFLMGDSAPPQVMRKLLRSPEISLLDFTQADGYTRRFNYLNKLEIPIGSIDFGKNIPPRTVRLIGPTVDLVARADLHPALSDLLLEAAREVHGNSSLLQRRGEFPAPLEHEFRISDDAARFYKTGKTFLYRNLPFWLASLVNRMLAIFVPMVVVLVPGLRLIPTVYRWRMKSRIFHWYRALLVLERDLFLELSPRKREEAMKELDRIEKAVSAMKLPASFADQFYDLRGHINFVRARLKDVARPM